MKRSTKLFAVMMVIGILFSFGGCGKSESDKSESDYKSAISAHMKSEHGVNVGSYQYLTMEDSGGASARISVKAQTDFEAEIDMSAKIDLDEKGNVAICSWCDLGIGYKSIGEQGETAP